LKPLSEFGRSIIGRGLERLGGLRGTSRAVPRVGAKGGKPSLGRDTWKGAVSGVPGPAALVGRSPAAQRILAVLAEHQARRTPFHNPLASPGGRMALAGDLLAVLERHHAYTAGHVRRVGQYSRMLGEAIGLGEAHLERLELGAVLHDIGKTAIPRSILRKEGALTQVEFEIMKHHTTIGADHMLGRVKELASILAIVRQHHERPVGGGYPLNLRGAEIDPLAKIVSIADAFDAMTSTRSYRQGMAPIEAYSRLRKAAGAGQLDAKLVETFIRTFEFRRSGRVIPVADRFRETVGQLAG